MMILQKRAQNGGGLCVGQVVRISAAGQAFVDFPGNRRGPIEARTILQGPIMDAASETAGQKAEAVETPVLLAFENGDPELPIIVGLIRDTFDRPAHRQELTLASSPDQELVVDGKKVALSAKEEIVLRCGKSSITLRKDGAIIVKGTHVVSRSSGANKVQGATVRLN